jgi:hypothetical protein
VDHGEEKAESGAETELAKGLAAVAKEAYLDGAATETRE